MFRNFHAKFYDLKRFSIHWIVVVFQRIKNKKPQRNGYTVVQTLLLFLFIAFRAFLGCYTDMNKINEQMQNIAYNRRVEFRNRWFILFAMITIVVSRCSWCKLNRNPACQWYHTVSGISVSRFIPVRNGRPVSQYFQFSFGVFWYFRHNYKCHSNTVARLGFVFRGTREEVTTPRPPPIGQSDVSYCKLIV